MLQFTDTTLNFEKNIAREDCLLQFTDIVLNLEKIIARVVCLLKHERDLAGPGVYLPASEPEVKSVTICSLAGRETPGPARSLSCFHLA